MATNKAGSSLYSYTVAPHLAAEFDVPLAEFATAHPQYNLCVIGGLIFTKRAPDFPLPASASRHAKEEHLSKSKSTATSIPGLPSPLFKPQNQSLMLIIQRSMSDSWGGYWDFPGGSLEADTDQTLLDGVAREVFEETGFHVRKIRDLARVDEWVMHKRRAAYNVAKFTFVVDVHEAIDTPEWEENVRLSPNEHMSWVWASEEEIKESARALRELKDNPDSKAVAPYAFVGVQGDTAWEGFRAYLRLSEKENS